ncbi:MAG: hypothetical protein KDD45_14560 [Bdellovibrionales bacterium]|nr:hypothetical protein [Bdellovibrionales bacterium]
MNDFSKYKFVENDDQNDKDEHNDASIRSFRLLHQVSFPVEQKKDSCGQHSQYYNKYNPGNNGSFVFN